MKVKDEFIIQRNGKPFVLYAGLLDLAHSMGLKKIETEIIQIPTKENGEVAIVRAFVHLGKEENPFNPCALTFTGIGDASPANVNPQMRHCLLRMAETRAKARALRDAVNVGVAAFEELGPDV